MRDRGREVTEADEKRRKKEKLSLNIPLYFVTNSIHAILACPLKAAKAIQRTRTK